MPPKHTHRGLPTWDSPSGSFQHSESHSLLVAPASKCCVDWKGMSVKLVTVLGTILYMVVCVIERPA